MSEILRIAAAWDRAKRAGEAAALLSVVATRGSTYRKAGAHMLVRSGGAPVGMISGGCLDRDLDEHAREVVRLREARVVAYDTTRDDAIVWGVGAGCRGTMEVLIEPLPGRSPEALFAAARLAATRREAVVVATVVRAPEGAPATGARIVFDPEGATEGTPDDPIVAAAVADVALSFRQRSGLEVSYVRGGGSIDLFLEYVAPPVAVMVIGAGDDAEPLVAIATRLGWEVTVADHRAAFAVPERFPGARVLTAAAEALEERIPLDERSAVVVMTHNYERDLALLRFLLRRPCGYLGVLGPRARTDQLIAALGEGAADAASVAWLHSPAGLDIGSRGPEEIALAIAAEIQKALAGGDGRSLRERAMRSRSAIGVDEP